MKKQVEKFIKEHKYINYCEAIIHPDGLIEYIAPSHVITLINITGESADAIYKKMPLTAHPLKWLVEYTGCISIWSNGYVKPKEYTKEQEASLSKLIESGLVKDRLF